MDESSRWPGVRAVIGATVGLMVLLACNTVMMYQHALSGMDGQPTPPPPSGSERFLQRVLPAAAIAALALIGARRAYLAPGARSGRSLGVSVGGLLIGLAAVGLLVAELFVFKGPPSCNAREREVFMGIRQYGSESAVPSHDGHGNCMALLQAPKAQIASPPISSACSITTRVR